MDNEKKKAPVSAEETIRHDKQGVSHRQGSFDMDKLRRDLEDSKRLHEEARRHKAEQARKAQAESAARAAGRTAKSAPQPAASATPKQTQAAPRAAKRQTDAEPVREQRQAARAEHQQKAKAALQSAALAVKKKKSQKEKKPHKPLRERKGCGCLFYLILLFVFLGVAFAALWMVRAHNAPTPIDQIPASERAAVAMEREKSNVYLLLAGTDQRADEASRSDTIMYAALRPVDRKIEMVSIPRDSLVEIPGVGEDKINASLAYGGVELLQETVENLVDNPVDHTVLINFESFADIIDAMGGIRINVEEDMYLPEEGIDLKAGEQKLDGHDALAFVRWRGDGTGDIGRMERQSEFMQALSEKVRHLTPWRAAMTLWTVQREIDTDMSILDILKLGWDFIGMSGDALEVQHFTYDTPYINGISYVILDDQSVEETIQLMKYGTIIDGSYSDESGAESGYYGDGTDESGYY